MYCKLAFFFLVLGCTKINKGGGERKPFDFSTPGFPFFFLFFLSLFPFFLSLLTILEKENTFTKVSSYNHNNSSNPNQNPFEDSSESGLNSSRFDYNAQYQQQQQHHQQDLIDLQQNQHQAFSNSTSSSTLQQQSELTTPAYIHQGSHQQIKRGDSSFALDEGSYHMKKEAGDRERERKKKAEEKEQKTLVHISHKEREREGCDFGVD